MPNTNQRFTVILNLLLNDKVSDEKKVGILKDNINIIDEETGDTLLIRFCKTNSVNMVDLTNNLKMVDQLLNQGTDVNAKNKDGYTALHYAVQKSEMEFPVFNLLLSNPNINVDAIKTNDQNITGLHDTPLSIAVMNGKKTYVERLLSRGANPNVLVTVSANETTIVWNLLLLLIQNAIQSSSATELYRKQIAMIQLLLTSGAKMDNWVSKSTTKVCPISMMLQRKNFAVLEYMMSAGIKHPHDLIMMQGLNNTFVKVTALFVTCFINSEKLFDLVISKNPNFDVNAEPETNNPCTPLIIASKNGCTAIVKKLLDLKVDVNRKDKDGNTALVAAILGKMTDTAKVLLSYKDIDVNLPNNHITPLLAAIDIGNVELIKLILEKDALDPNSSYKKTNKSDHSALFVAYLKGNSEIIKILLEHYSKTSNENKSAINLLIDFLPSYAEINNNSNNTNNNEKSNNNESSSQSTLFKNSNTKKNKQAKNTNRNPNVNINQQKASKKSTKQTTKTLFLDASKNTIPSHPSEVTSIQKNKITNFTNNNWATASDDDKQSAFKVLRDNGFPIKEIKKMQREAKINFKRENAVKNTNNNLNNNNNSGSDNNSETIHWHGFNTNMPEVTKYISGSPNCYCYIDIKGINTRKPTCDQTTMDRFIEHKENFAGEENQQGTKYIATQKLYSHIYLDDGENIHDLGVQPLEVELKIEGTHRLYGFKLTSSTYSLYVYVTYENCHDEKLISEKYTKEHIITVYMPQYKVNEKKANEKDNNNNNSNNNNNNAIAFKKK